MVVKIRVYVETAPSVFTELELEMSSVVDAMDLRTKIKLAFLDRKNGTQFPWGKMSFQPLEIYFGKSHYGKELDRKFLFIGGDFHHGWCNVIDGQHIDKNFYLG